MKVEVWIPKSRRVVLSLPPLQWRYFYLVRITELPLTKGVYQEVRAHWAASSYCVPNAASHWKFHETRISQSETRNLFCVVDWRCPNTAPLLPLLWHRLTVVCFPHSKNNNSLWFHRGEKFSHIFFIAKFTFSHEQIGIVNFIRFPKRASARI